MEAFRAKHPRAAVSGEPVYAGLGATQADYLERGGVMACFDQMKGFRAQQMADRLSSKRATVAAPDRAELEAWITAWRTAEQARVDEPTPPNPADPQGFFKFLTNADQQEMNMAYSAAHNTIMAECNSMDQMGLGAKNTKGKFGN